MKLYGLLLFFGIWVATIAPLLILNLVPDLIRDLLNAGFGLIFVYLMLKGNFFGGGGKRVKVVTV